MAAAKPKENVHAFEEGVYGWIIQLKQLEMTPEVVGVVRIFTINQVKQWFYLLVRYYDGVLTTEDIRNVCTSEFRNVKNPRRLGSKSVGWTLFRGMEKSMDSSS